MNLLTRPWPKGSPVKKLKKGDRVVVGRGPDRCTDAEGIEPHGTGLDYMYDRIKHTSRLESDRPIVLRQAIKVCRKGGTISVVGVYGGFIDKFSMGAAIETGTYIQDGTMYAQKYIPALLDHIENGRIDPSYLLTRLWPS